MSPTPGILYVNSKITSEALTPEIFRDWYEGVHIPDILATSGVNSGFRYQSTTPELAERPFLALYPVEDIQWLYSSEFKSISLHSDLLPNDSKAIFDVADFDSRYYELILTVFHGLQRPTKHVVVVEFDNSSGDDVELLEASIPAGTKPLRSHVFKLNFSRPKRLPGEESNGFEPRAYLGFVRTLLFF